MEIRFFRNPAGQRLAYVDEGRGPLVVVPAWWVSHLERDAESPSYRRFFADLAKHHRVVRFDRVGVGLSDRARRDFSVEAELADLEALIQHLGPARVHLFACSCGGPVALAYAARHPERVDKVVLYASYVEGAALSKPDLQRALVGLVRAHWGLGSRTLADLFHPGDADARERFTALQKVSADAETAARLLELTFALDARTEAPRVRSPVLVLHRKGDRVIPPEHGRTLAATLSDARLVLLEGGAHMPWDGDGGAVVEAATRFLGTAEGEAAAGEELRRDGDVWSVRFAGRTALVSHRKGLSDLARLLGRPGEKHHVFDILGIGRAERRDGDRGSPTLDRAALASYRDRLADIDASLEEAAPDRREALLAEREALLERIAADTGLRGRPRKLQDPLERARKAVTARIRDAIRRLRPVHPELADHLEASIVTGVLCVYRPERAVTWTVSPGPI